MALNLKAYLSLDGTGFMTGLAGAERGVHRFVGSTLGSLKGQLAAVFTVAAFTKLTKDTIAWGSSLDKAAKRMSVTAEQAQIMAEAASEADVDLGLIESAMVRLSKGRAEALIGGQGGKEKERQFAALGITQDMLKTMSSFELLVGPIQKAFQTLSPDQLAGSMELLGKSYRDMIPVFEANFDALGEKMKRLGVIIDGPTVSALARLEDEMTIVSKILIATFAPALVKLANFILDLISNNPILQGASTGIAVHSNLRAAGYSGVLGPIQAQERAKQARDLFEVWRKSGGTMSGGDLFDKSTGGFFGSGVNAAPQWKLDLSTKTAEEVEPFLRAIFEPVNKIEVETLMKTTKWFDDLGKSIAELRAEVEANAAGYGRRGPVDYGEFFGQFAAPEKMKAARSESGDALVRVGNFLGSSRSMVDTLAQENNRALKEIAVNTQTLAREQAAWNRRYSARGSMPDRDFSVGNPMGIPD